MELAQSFVEQPLYKRLKPSDWLYAVVVLVAAGQAWRLYNPFMDGYEQAILWFSAVSTILLGWFFKPLRWFVPLSIALAYGAVKLYSDNIDNGEGFLLRYFLSSQSAIMWQCAFVFFALFCYIAGAVAAGRQHVPTNTLLDMASAFGWVSALAGFTGLLVRWHESYLLRPDAGHMPVSTLYEVFILFLDRSVSHIFIFLLRRRSLFSFF